MVEWTPATEKGTVAEMKTIGPIVRDLAALATSGVGAWLAVSSVTDFERFAGIVAICGGLMVVGAAFGRDAGDCGCG